LPRSISTHLLMSDLVSHNGIFIIALLTTLSAEGLIPAILYIVVAIILIAVSFTTTVRANASRIIQTRLAVFLPIVWFIISCTIYYQGSMAIPRPLMWSGVQTWHATIFVWLCVYWLISYVLRIFEFDAPRQFAWATLTSITLLVWGLSIFMPFLIKPPFPDFFQHFASDAAAQDVLVTYMSQMNSDALGHYVPYTRDFPYSWIGNTTIQRPTYFVVSSQICQTLDIFSSGYISGQRECGTRYGFAALVNWLFNGIMAVVSTLILYELVRAYSGNSYLAWIAGALLALSPYTLWYISIPSTDYSEILIAMASLWMIHRLFAQRNKPVGRIIAYGLMFGALLLLKLNMLYLVFGLALVILTHQKPRLILTFLILPMVVWILYTKLIPLTGIPYRVIEFQFGNDSVGWVYLKFIHYTPFQMLYVIAKWVGYTALQTVMNFGVLLIVGIYVMITDRRYPRYLFLLFGLMFLCSVFFEFIARISYPSHVIGLAPFIFGAVALGVESLQTAIRQRFTRNLRLASALALLVLALVIGHNLLLWTAWDIRDRMNIVVFQDFPKEIILQPDGSKS
ncbi:MAG: hypothetical protein ABI947_21430, partial [Chloroflexota bacterium]